MFKSFIADFKMADRLEKEQRNLCDINDEDFDVYYPPILRKVFSNTKQSFNAQNHMKSVSIVWT